MTSEQKIIEANSKLLIRGDDTEVKCEDHGVAKRWGDLGPLTQLAILSGLDIEGDTCIMDHAGGVG